MLVLCCHLCSVDQWLLPIGCWLPWIPMDKVSSGTAEEFQHLMLKYSVNVIMIMTSYIFLLFLFPFFLYLVSPPPSPLSLPPLSLPSPLPPSSVSLPSFSKLHPLNGFGAANESGSVYVYQFSIYNNNF